MEQINNLVQLADQERFADFSDNVKQILNDRIRTSDNINKAKQEITNYNNIKELFSQINKKGE